MIIDLTMWGWPQWTLVVIMAIEFLMVLVNHGQTKELPTYNIFIHTFNAVFILVLLSFGGFFNG